MLNSPGDGKFNRFSAQKHPGKADKRRSPDDAIAIIGIGCRLPGNADSPAAFWDLLCKGVDAIVEIPTDRWSVRSFYDPEAGVPGKTNTRWGGFLQGIDQFDAQFFGISPREAKFMDPQQRLLLEVAYEAIDDGGQSLDRLSGSNTGVFIGISTNDYARIQYASDDRNSIDTYTSTGGVMSIAANRISYCFDLRGPSLIVDTACSSSLVAVHLACQSIRNKECPLALAGGVNIIICPEEYIGFSKMSLLSSDGRCKAFDASGNGFVRSEGAGIVVLKPLLQSLADGDNIYAVIRASATNQDGRTNGISVPSQAAQEALLRAACRQAGILPEEIQYVEAHGTGTAVGDPIEANALGAVLCAGRAKGRYCYIGSVKTNIGHLEAGAGIAGLIKVALALNHNLIPPSLHFQNPNPRIPFEDLKLRVQQVLGPWPDDCRTKLAGVNSFGFGGANAHVVMAEAPPAKKSAAANRKAPANMPCLVPLSARNPAALKSYVQAILDLVRAHNEGLGEVGRSLSLRRSHHDHRLAVVARNEEEFIERLEAFLVGDCRAGMHSGVTAGKQERKIVFVFSGQGSQWWAMGRQLLDSEPRFRQAIEECDALLSRYAKWSLLEQFTVREEKSRLQETAIAQPALFALQVALVALWRSWGIVPALVVGHSVGEIAAAHIAGALDLATAIEVVFHRGRCMDLASSRGRMLGAELTIKQAEELIAGRENLVSIAAVNSPSSVTLSGDPDTLAQLSRILEQRNTYCSFLKVQYAFHSPQMDPVRRELGLALQNVRPKPTTIPIFSTVMGRCVDGGEFDAEYWWKNVRQPVLFARAALDLAAQGYDTFLEIGPHPVLSNYVAACLHEKERVGLVLCSLRRTEDEQLQMLASLGSLYVHGCRINWLSRYPEQGRFIRLPRYPWQHESHWHECATSKEGRIGATAHPLLAHRVKSADLSWNVQLSYGSFPYLWDHQVQDHAVFPAAAYVEMALALASQLGLRRCVLEDVTFHKAFFLPQSSDAPTLQITYYASDSSFCIYGRTSSDERQWTLHATGKVRAEQNDQVVEGVDLSGLLIHCPERVSREHHYRTISKSGLQFGPSFQGIGQIWRGERAAVGRISTPEQLRKEVHDYVVHPAVLDACFQVLSAATSPEAPQGISELFLPVRIDQVRFVDSPGFTTWSDARLSKCTPKSISGNIRILKEDGKPCMHITGFTCQAVGTGANDSAFSMDDCIYETRWQSKPRALDKSSHVAADFLPPSEEMETRLRLDARKLSDGLGWKSRHAEVQPELQHLCSAYVLRAFRKLGARQFPSDLTSLDAIFQQLGIVPERRETFRHLLRILFHDGLLTKTSEGWQLQEDARSEPVGDVWKRILKSFPAYYMELALTAKCGSQLADILQGKVNPLHIIFPEDSSIAEHLYEDSPSFKFYNLLASRALALAVERVPEGRKVRLLEIGAGTGGMTSYLLLVLPSIHVEYVFTDVSSIFLDKAEQKFCSHPFLKYQLLDIEKDPIAQGLEAQSFDIIVASDVLHATRSLRESLSNVRMLLRSGGLLVLLETDNPPRWVDLVFGLTDGWWRFSDRDLRPNYPLLSRDRWLQLLSETGFLSPIALSEIDSTSETSQAVFVARGPAVREVNEEERQIEAAPRQAHKRWLIFKDRLGVGDKLHAILQANGADVISVNWGSEYRWVSDHEIQICPAIHEGYQQLLHDVVVRPQVGLDGVVHCWSLDIALPNHSSISWLDDSSTLACYSVMHFIQAWASTALVDAPALRLVTGGAQAVGDIDSVSVGQSPLCGLARVIINEHQEFRCKLIDLSPRSSDQEIRSLFEELVFEGDDENEIALRADRRFVPRLVRRSHGHVCDTRPIDAPRRPYGVEIRTPGVLDLAITERERRKPCSGEIEISVVAAGLNFRDIMKALAIYPADDDEDFLLGDECAGVITAVGDGVEDLRVGDEVIAVTRGCLGSFVTARADFAILKPAHLTFEESVTVPIAFLTAFYALHHVGRIRRGERVLIHAATGGVGLAAIQVALQAGAEVFATAGTVDKRSFLNLLGIRHVMDSRKLSFADEIMEITGNRGVNIVLNSLAGDAIPKGLACLAKYGRFLEIGKKDIYLNTKLELRCFKNGLSFTAIDLSRIMADQPLLVRKLLTEVIRLFGTRDLSPIPYRTIPVGNAASAFRCLAKARHIGKVVLSTRDQPQGVEPLKERRVAFSKNATFLISGGVGGFGLALAEWMVDRGAQYLVLMSRREPSSDDAQRVLQRLGKRAHIIQVRADVAKQDDLSLVLNKVRESLPPLRGIVHAAMVLDDGVLLQLNNDRFKRVMEPKVCGAWNLHSMTLEDHLDFFVLFSSATSTCGNPGQANYAAANAFLDSLAQYRRAQNRPALTVNWGNLTDVGHVARHAELDKYLRSIGIGGFTSMQALDVLGLLLMEKANHVAVMNIDWPLWTRYALVKSSPRFSLLISTATTSKRGDASRLCELVGMADADKRPAIVQSYVKEEVARVLGIASARVDLEQSLSEMGVDSLMTVELKNRIAKELGVVLPTADLMRGPSVAKLAALLFDQLKGSPASNEEGDRIRSNLSRQRERQRTEELLHRIDEMPEKEMDVLLNEFREYTGR